MTGNSILSRIAKLGRWCVRKRSSPRLDLGRLWLQPTHLPTFVTDTPVALRTLDLLGPLDWSGLPERNLMRNWGKLIVPHGAFVAACLIKLNEGCASMGDLRQYLVEHPALVWLCGFPLVCSSTTKHGFDAQCSLPTQRHLTRMLRELPNVTLQFLLSDTVRLIYAQLDTLGLQASDCIVLDTKHVIAWVKANNPKAYVEDRYDKCNQPSGDPDCRLGCKRHHNRQPVPTPEHDHAHTPTRNPVSANGLAFGEYYWGYGSGIVVANIPKIGEFVLAEMTQPFDRADVSYFLPLMAQVEVRLGHKPRIGVFDAAFDAWYVYAYFHRDDDPLAFAAVPFSEKGGYKANGRCFTPDGLPVCAAGLPMPLQLTFVDRSTTIVTHERGRYVCPLRYPALTGQSCPVQHKNWAKKGCTVQMPTSIGARLRYTLDRTSQSYKDIFKQRTTVERINSQAVALGIERPHLRNGAAITNLNTLIYILINLRFLRRLRQL